MDDVITAVAAALAAKAADAAFEGGKRAITAVKNLVRERFRNDPAAHAALEQADRNPDQAAAAADLAQAIKRICDTDPDFAVRLRELWAQVPHEQVVNIATGNVTGHLIQARDIHGGIRF